MRECRAWQVDAEARQNSTLVTTRSFADAGERKRRLTTGPPLRACGRDLRTPRRHWRWQPITACETWYSLWPAGVRSAGAKLTPLPAPRLDCAAFRFAHAASGWSLRGF